jgi:hypothetical protein
MVGQFLSTVIPFPESRNLMHRDFVSHMMNYIPRGSDKVSDTLSYGWVAQFWFLLKVSIRRRDKTALYIKRR